MSTIVVQSSDTRIHMNNGRIELSRGPQTLATYPETTVDDIVVMGNPQITTQTVKRCLQLGVNIIYLSSNGKYYGHLQPQYSCHTDRLVHQVQLFSTPLARRRWAISLVKAKIKTELIELRRIQNNHWTNTDDARKILRKQYAELPDSPCLSRLMGIEALTAKTMFHVFAAALPHDWEWQGRSRNPPLTPANSLLSLAGAIVSQKLYSVCITSGLHPELGFLHSDGYRRPNLILDLLEPFRAIFCLHLTLLTARHKILTPADFQSSPETGIRLTPAKFPVFLQTLNHAFTHSVQGRSCETLLKQLISSVCSSVDTESCPDFSALLPER